MKYEESNPKTWTISWTMVDSCCSHSESEESRYCPIMVIPATTGLDIDLRVVENGDLPVLLRAIKLAGIAVG